MNTHEHHDDHLATAIHSTYATVQTTAAAHHRIDELERSLHLLWARLLWVIAAGATALAGFGTVLWLAVNR